jgi:hypothetical protein
LVFGVCLKWHPDAQNQTGFRVCLKPGGRWLKVVLVRAFKHQRWIFDNYLKVKFGEIFERLGRVRAICVPRKNWNLFQKLAGSGEQNWIFDLRIWISSKPWIDVRNAVVA